MRCNFVLAAVNVVVAVVVASAAVGFMQIVGQLWWQWFDSKAVFETSLVWSNEDVSGKELDQGHEKNDQLPMSGMA